MDGLEKTLRFRRVKNIFNTRKEAMDYIEENRKSRYGEPIAARYRGDKNRVYTLLAIGSTEYSTKNPNSRYQYFDPGEMQGIIDSESEEREKNDANIIKAVGLNDDGSHIRSTGKFTSGRTFETLSGEEKKIETIEDEILVLDAELYRANERDKIDKSKIIEAVGLAEDGTYKTIGYYYTKEATTVADCIKTLDSKTHDIETLIGKKGDPKTRNTVYGYIEKLKDEVFDKSDKIENTLELEDGKYVPYTKEDGTAFINGQNSVRDEIRALDFVLQRIVKEIEEIHEKINKN
jgi:hypothetical protein